MHRARLLLTGGAGFIGSHLLRCWNDEFEVVALDGLNYASAVDRVEAIPSGGWVFHDLRAPITRHVANQIGKVDYIVHTAAETHVDNSMVDPLRFVQANVLGTAHVLEFARMQRLRKYVQLSTDEVFGTPANRQAFVEDDRHRPSNPYSATKAAADDLVLAWAHCYRVPACVLHSMNCFGLYQHPEKFIPSTVRKILDGERVILHGKGTDMSRRKWLYVDKLASALKHVLFYGEEETNYNVEGEEADVLEVALFIAKALGVTLSYEVVDYHAVRPGHDMFYNLKDTKLTAAGWPDAANYLLWPTLEAVIKKMAAPTYRKFLEV